MPDDQERAAMQANIAAIGGQGGAAGAKKPRKYVVHASVFDECIGMPAPGGPDEPIDPEGESVHARLERIEKQLARVIAMLEK